MDELSEKIKSRVEKLIPDYGNLKFVNKDEKKNEESLNGMSKKDIVVWRQLESQAHMANEKLEKTLDILESWLEDYEDVRDMVVVQKSLRVIDTFGSLLLALDSRIEFLMSILSPYLHQINKEKEKVVQAEKDFKEKYAALDKFPKLKEVVIETKKLISHKEGRNVEIFEDWQRRISTKLLAKKYSLSLRGVQLIIKKMKDRTRRNPYQNETIKKFNANDIKNKDEDDKEPEIIENDEAIKKLDEKNGDDSVERRDITFNRKEKKQGEEKVILNEGGKIS